ncbi:MAG: hypothetical protein D9V47_02010 [Clostridia bacterium]|nr:MAG: hypothetical protein D9V47_02010 [Clostridia bacterium]
MKIWSNGVIGRVARVGTPQVEILRDHALEELAVAVQADPKPIWRIARDLDESRAELPVFKVKVVVNEAAQAGGM